MTESGAQGSDWIAWIAQQREHLRSMTTGAGEPAFAAQSHDLAGRWLDVGGAYLRGLADFVKSSAGEAQAVAGPSAALSEEMLRAWTGATSMGQDESRRFADALGRLPPLGITREHTEAMRALAAAQREHQELEQALRAELVRVQNDALNLLEQRVRERDLANNPISEWRELYDLWVECGEQVFSQVAHSDAYGKLQAELGNAAVRLRARQQTIFEHELRQFDLPTRSELNTIHRQIRELRDRLEALDSHRGNSVRPGSDS
jgi:class III poly(R)-hydroxyalkanoic acid synthase PhaE subunit